MQAISRPFFAAIFIILVSMAWPANAKVSPSFTPLVLKPKSEKYQSWYEFFRDGGRLDGIANGLSQGIKLPTSLLLITKECGRVNAFYVADGDRQAIVMCYEIMDHIERKMERKTRNDIFVGKQSPEIMDKLWTGAFTFLLMHEVGHALIHTLDLPVLGQEEDAADKIATYFLLEMAPPAPAGKQSAYLMGAVWFWQREGFFLDFSDEHSLDPQRQVNLACWIYGKDPSRFQYFKKYMWKARADRCEHEYAQLRAAVHKLLAGNVQLPD